MRRLGCCCWGKEHAPASRPGFDRAVSSSSSLDSGGLDALVSHMSTLFCCVQKSANISLRSKQHQACLRGTRLSCSFSSLFCKKCHLRVCHPHPDG